MGFLERVGELTARAVRMDLEVRQIREEVQATNTRLDRFDQKLQNLEKAQQQLELRVIRLETAREADRAQLETQITRFSLEVEKAKLHFKRGLPPASNE